MSFSEKCVVRSIQLLLARPAEDVVSDLKEIAVNDFVGLYDIIVRVPKSEATDKTRASVIALRVVRAALKHYKATGRIEYGHVNANAIHNYFDSQNL